jgi:hypothetical protein
VSSQNLEPDWQASADPHSRHRTQHFPVPALTQKPQLQGLVTRPHAPSRLVIPSRSGPLVRFTHVTWLESQAFPVVRCRSPASDWAVASADKTHQAMWPASSRLPAADAGGCGGFCWRLGHVFTALLLDSTDQRMGALTYFT